MTKYLYSRREALKFNKFGIDLTVHNEGVPGASVCHVSVKEGHFEEFKNTSHFMYYILEGSGVFVLNNEHVMANAGDLVVVPPNTPIHYFGAMEMTLTVTPAWKEENETHIRDIDPKENPLA